MLKFQAAILDRMPLEEAIQLMEGLLIPAVQQKKAYLLFTEHPLVYTSGVNTKKEHIRVDSLPLVSVRRGGSVTLHAPGQLMFYTVLPLEAAPGGLSAHIRRLEFSILRAFMQVGIPSFLLPPHSGVFTTKGKIAFIGLGLKRGSVYHGAAINLSNALEPYQPIFSCGLQKPITRAIDFMEEAKTKKFRFMFIQKLKYFFMLLHNPIRPSQERKRLEQEQEFYLQQGYDIFWQGLHYFNARDFWRAHEAWEIYWHKIKEPNQKKAVQFFIQWAMANYKLTQEKNFKGAQSLLQKAAWKIEFAEQQFASLQANQKPFRLFFKEIQKKPQVFMPVVFSW